MGPHEVLQGTPWDPSGPLGVPNGPVEVRKGPLGASKVSFRGLEGVHLSRLDPSLIVQLCWWDQFTGQFTD